MAWETLAAINRVNRDTLQQELAEPPVVCPNDSTVLDVTAKGIRHCPFDGWIWNGHPFPK